MFLTRGSRDVVRDSMMVRCGQMSGGVVERVRVLVDGGPFTYYPSRQTEQGSDGKYVFTSPPGKGSEVEDVNEKPCSIFPADIVGARDSPAAGVISYS